MKQKWLIVLAGVTLLLLSLAGCDGTGTPTCPAANLKAPVLVFPAMWASPVELTASLSWSYPDTSCNPQGYNIHIKHGALLNDFLNGGTGNAATSWSPDYPWPLGEQFAWDVHAVVGSTVGPSSGNGYFFTGPMCDPDALSAPQLLQPLNGSVITDLAPSLIWQNAHACLPESYRVDLSTDVTFADTSLSGMTGNPSQRWAPGKPLADCTVYFWKTVPIIGTTFGPYSDVFSFSTNVSGTCPTPTPVDPTFTPTPVGPSPTPVPPTLTPTPPPLTFTPNLNAYCRFGPNLSFPSSAIAMTGQPYLMDGRNLDNTWYRIMVTAGKGCWVPSTSGLPSRDPSGLRVLAEIPTFTPTDVPTDVPTLVPSDTPTEVVDCASFTSADTCGSQPACVWYQPPAGGPAYCTDK